MSVKTEENYAYQVLSTMTAIAKRRLLGVIKKLTLIITLLVNPPSGANAICIHRKETIFTSPQGSYTRCSH